VESTNEEYSLKVQQYSQTDCFQLPSMQIIDFIHLTTISKLGKIKERLGLKTNI